MREGERTDLVGFRPDDGVPRSSLGIVAPIAMITVSTGWTTAVHANRGVK